MEKKLAISLMTEQKYLQKQISILKKSTPEADIHSQQCPFCNERQKSWIDNKSSKNMLFHLCACEEMRQYQRKKQKLLDYEERLSLIENRFEQERIRVKKCLVDGGLGKRFQNAGFENYERKYMPKAYDMALEYADSFLKKDCGGLIFTGDVGTGKTHLAVAIANQIIQKYAITVEFASYVDLLANVKAALAYGTGNCAEIEKKYSKAPLLIIDDFGKEKQSQFTDEFLFRLVNRRYENELPYIITTNLRLPELADRLNYAVFSRIVESCKAVDMSGPDFRLKGYLG